MDSEVATTKARAYIWGTMVDRDLRASLEAIGVQLPGLELDGVLIDGKKKAHMCAEMRLPFPITVAKSLAEACSILWTRHPQRALELAGARPLLELAALCSASVTAIAKQLAQTRPKKSHHAPPKRIIEQRPIIALKNTSKMVKRLFLLEPELYAYAKEAAAQLGHRNVNRLVRDALWKECALRVPNAPQFQPRRVQPPNGARATRRRSG